MLKHASTTSSTAATATAAVAINPLSSLLGGQLLRTAVNSSSNINCNGNSNTNSNSSSSNNHTGSSGSGQNTPPVVETEAGIATTNSTTGNTGTNTTNGGSPTPAAAAVASTARNIHLRPPQPLNISALNASASSTVLNDGGGGGRGCVGNSSTLLNIATPSTPLKPLTPLTPLTQLTPNGHFLGNGSVHHHTYTNQHILASSSNHLQQQQLQQQQQQQQQQHHQQHAQAQGLNHSQVPHNYRNYSHLTTNPVGHKFPKSGPSPREALTSLGLLCLISLLLAMLSLIFLLRISPNGREDAVVRGAGGEDFIVVYDVTLALGALSLSLNLCCLLVCAIQFLFAVKLREPAFEGRENQYLAKSSASRTCAVSGLFISIPVFLTGLILYTFSHFHSTPAIVTSLLIGVGIVFCGGAMVHNVFVWQREKTISYRGAPPGLTHNLSVISGAQLPVTMPMPLPLPPGPFHAYQGSHQSHQGHMVPPSVTAVSPNHSHGSFNPLLLGGGGGGGGCCGGGGGTMGAVNSSFLVRPATATPPTPTPRTLANSSCLTAGREASGSVSPGIPPTLDMSNITVLLHELSTLV
ncbi:uncharacterized protein LOC108105063 [Drosophila eugracilis]|uniref:uncharacterized protein LOC108105063 n=1 Tax=Drosophila eugracilis TaxID=29029 RepID=UPI0007E5C3B6|nr:uncharacterized protein LOC108105063 [Drosophila eugracilis]XP_017066971.1 uncharacterized protein LOC108105063 [Drosophila eugracilis]